MDEPISWLALQEVKDIVSGITRANHFHTDLGLGRIITDRSQLKLEGTDAVTLIVAGDISPDGASTSRIENSSMSLTLEFAVPFDNEAPELLAHRAAADLRRALKRSVRGAPKYFNKITVESTTFDSDVSENNVLFTLAQVTARAGLTENFSPAQS